MECRMRARDAAPQRHGRLGPRAQLCEAREVPIAERRRPVDLREGLEGEAEEIDCQHESANRSMQHSGKLLPRPKEIDEETL